MRMLERVIFEVLAAGRDHINEDHKFLREFFSDDQEGPGLSKLEIDDLDAFWKSVKSIDVDGSEQTGVSIIHQFPRETTRFPAWAIVLINENEDKQVLGDEAGIIGDRGEDILTSFWAKSYAVFTYAPDPLLCMYYYELCRFFMTRGRPFLKSAAGGYSLTTKFAGGDMGPDARYQPANMFVRRFQIDLTREERVRGDPQLRGTKVRGIYGERENNQDVQQVTTKTTTYTVDPGENDGQ